MKIALLDYEFLIFHTLFAQWKYHEIYVLEFVITKYTWLNNIWWFSLIFQSFLMIPLIDRVFGYMTTLACDYSKFR